MRRGLRFELAVAACLGLACGAPSGSDGGAPDAGPGTLTDAGPDAGVDAGLDAGADAGPGDAGLTDAGLDAGLDAGPSDGGLEDAGLDAGPADAGGFCLPTFPPTTLVISDCSQVPAYEQPPLGIGGCLSPNPVPV